MGQLAGVLLHVGTLNQNLENLTGFKLDVDLALEGNRLVVLRGLEVLCKVRVEVVLS